MSLTWSRSEQPTRWNFDLWECALFSSRLEWFRLSPSGRLPIEQRLRHYEFGTWWFLSLTRQTLKKEKYVITYCHHLLSNSRFDSYQCFQLQFWHVSSSSWLEQLVEDHQALVLGRREVPWPDRCRHHCHPAVELEETISRRNGIFSKHVTTWFIYHCRNAITHISVMLQWLVAVQ